VRLYLYDTAAYDTAAALEDLALAAEQYERFIHQWYNKFHVICEFDSPTMGKEWILQRRDQFYDEERFADKYWVSWHPSYGLDHLKRLGESYTDVVVPVSALQETGVLSVIASTRQDYQTSFHCNGFSLDRASKHELFDSIFMSTWSSALRHGDVYVPHGSWIRRVPKDEQAVTLKQQGEFIESIGCDPQALIDGSSQESELYTVRLFRNLETSYSAILGQLLDSSGNVPETGTSGEVVEVTDSEGRSDGKTGLRLVDPNYPESGGRHYPIMARTLPTLEMEPSRSFQPDSEGRMVIADVPVVRRTGDTMRVCDSCSLSNVCPAFQAHNACKFKMPVQIRTREQLAALTEAMLEIQAGRVFFASFGEEVQGYPDPNVGKELDRFMKLAKDAAKLGEAKETLRIERTSGQGVMSQLFGRTGPRE
jgi:hypothetical protein